MWTLIPCYTTQKYPIRAQDNRAQNRASVRLHDIRITVLNSIIEGVIEHVRISVSLL